MTELEIFEFVFIDNLLSAMVIPIKTEYAYEALLAFGGHNNMLLAAVATISSTIGATVGWMVGRVVARIEKSELLKLPEDKLNKAIKIFNTRLVLVLLFTWLNFVGNPITVIAGFLKTRLIIFLALTALGNLIYYFSLIALLGS